MLNYLANCSDRSSTPTSLPQIGRNSMTTMPYGGFSPLPRPTPTEISCTSAGPAMRTSQTLCSIFHTCPTRSAPRRHGGYLKLGGGMILVYGPSSLPDPLNPLPHLLHCHTDSNRPPQLERYPHAPRVPSPLCGSHKHSSPCLPQPARLQDRILAPAAV